MKWCNLHASLLCLGTCIFKDVHWERISSIESDKQLRLRSPWNMPPGKGAEPKAESTGLGWDAFPRLWEYEVTKLHSLQIWMKETQIFAMIHTTWKGLLAKPCRCYPLYWASNPSWAIRKNYMAREIFEYWIKWWIFLNHQTHVSDQGRALIPLSDHFRAVSAYSIRIISIDNSLGCCFFIFSFPLRTFLIPLFVTFHCDCYSLARLSTGNLETLIFGGVARFQNYFRKGFDDVVL